MIKLKEAQRNKKLKQFIKEREKQASGNKSFFERILNSILKKNPKALETSKQGYGEC